MEIIRSAPAGFRWPTGRLYYVGEVAHARLAPLAERAGLPVDCYDEEGLGPTTSTVALLPSGVAVLLTEREHTLAYAGATGPTVEADAADVAARGAAAIFSEALAALGLGRAHIAHEPPPPDPADPPVT